MSEAKRAKTEAQTDVCEPCEAPKKALANTGKDDMIALRVSGAFCARAFGRVWLCGCRWMRPRLALSHSERKRESRAEREREKERERRERERERERDATPRPRKEGDRHQMRA